MFIHNPDEVGKNLDDEDIFTDENEDGVSSQEEDTPEGQEPDYQEEQKEWTEEDVWRCLNAPPTYQQFEDYAERYGMDIIGMKDLYSVFVKFGVLNFRKMIQDKLIDIKHNARRTYEIIPVTTYLKPND